MVTEGFIRMVNEVFRIRLAQARDDKVVSVSEVQCNRRKPENPLYLSGTSKFGEGYTAP